MPSLKIISLNLNHRTRCRDISKSLIQSLNGLSPDIIALNEIVICDRNRGIIEELAKFGLHHTAISKQVPYSATRNHNQVLIASKQAFIAVEHYDNAPDPGANSNILTVKLPNTTMTAVRAPMYKKRSEWSEYWTWLSSKAKGDILIGDLNVDPSRGNKRDLEYRKLTKDSQWNLCEIEGDYSYQGTNGSKARLDHLLTRNRVRVKAARYISDGILPEHTDHAALYVELI
jgi:endonuclease/exonuclease/phosphatase family metal-dependent hydrolase